MEKPDITAVYEAMIAMSVALSEQLDIDRLIVALHRQVDVYRAQSGAAHQQTADLLTKVGRALTDIDRVRKQRRGEPH